MLLQRNENPKRKNFFAYEIQIVPLNDVDGEKWSLLRRYSEFHRLHKYLQKDNMAIKTVDFPPKRSFGNMVSDSYFAWILLSNIAHYAASMLCFQNAEFVEQRRQRLQVYLLSVLSLIPEISRCNTRAQLEVVFPFFKQTHQILWNSFCRMLWCPGYIVHILAYNLFTSVSELFGWSLELHHIRNMEDLCELLLRSILHTYLYTPRRIYVYISSYLFKKKDITK